MIIYCGQCGKKLLPDDSAAGKVGVCAGCKSRVPIPKAETKKTPICIFCPECNAKLSAPIHQAGKKISCPKCNAEVRLHILDKSKLGITSKVIDSGLIDLEDVEELRKIPFPPPPTGKGPSAGPLPPGGEPRPVARPAGALLPKIVILAVVLVALFQLFREITLNLKVSDASNMAVQERYRDAVSVLDSVMMRGPLTIAKWRAAGMRREYDRLARAQAAFDTAKQFAVESPENYRGAARLFAEVVGEFEGAIFATQAESEIKAIELKVEMKARPVMKDLMGRVEDLIGNGKYDEARKLPDEFPEEYLSPKWEAEMASVRKEVEGKIEAAKGLLAKGAVWRDGRWISGDRKEMMDRIQFEKEQRAKGLIQVNGEWITPEERDRRERERIEEARHSKGMVEIYKDKWLSKDELGRMRRRVFIESRLPQGSADGLAKAIEQAGMIPTTSDDRAECAYLLRASHTMDARPDLRTPDAGMVKVTVTATVFQQEIENPEAPRDKLTIKEKELFTIREEGRKMTSMKGAVESESGAKAVLVMETTAIANAVEFIQGKLAAKLREMTGAPEAKDAAAVNAKADSLAKRLRMATSDSLRQKAAADLVAMGKSAVPALIDLLKDKSPKVRLCAVQALGEIGDPSALHFLLDLQEKAERKEEGKDVGEAAREAARIIYQKNK
ncbi:MAG: HEAT repeat domain-containing protein [Planctomycetota bacterium]